MPLDRQMQSQLCLTPAHERCERYLAHLTRAGRAVSARAAFGDGLVTTRLLLAPEPAWRGIAGRARRAPPGSLVVAAAATLAVGVGGVALAAAVVDGRIALGDMTATPSPSLPPAASPTPRPTATLSPEPSDTPSPSAVPSPAATPPPTAVPTPPPTVAPTPAPQQTYVVQEGDTLAAIAQQFGTSVEAIQSANGISDPNEILIGQVLVIP